MSNSVLLSTIIADRHTTRTAPAALYGSSDSKTLYGNLCAALYDWRVAGIAADAGKSVDVKAAQDKAFDAARDLLKVFNEHMDADRKLKFSVNSLLTLRDGAISYGYVANQDTRDLSTLVNVCKFRLQESDKMGYVPSELAHAMEMVQAYCAANHHDPMLTFAINPDDLGEVASLVTKDNAADVKAVAEAILTAMGKDGVKGEKAAKMPSANVFRKYVEDTIADMVEKNLAKTSAQIAEERKQLQAYRKKNRRNESRGTK